MTSASSSSFWVRFRQALAANLFAVARALGRPVPLLVLGAAIFAATWSAVTPVRFDPVAPRFGALFGLVGIVLPLVAAVVCVFVFRHEANVEFAGLSRNFAPRPAPRTAGAMICGGAASAAVVGAGSCVAVVAMLANSRPSTWPAISELAATGGIWVCKVLVAGALFGGLATGVVLVTRSGSASIGLLLGLYVVEPLVSDVPGLKHVYFPVRAASGMADGVSSPLAACAWLIWWLLISYVAAVVVQRKVLPAIG